MAADDAPRAWSLADEDEGFALTNLYPRRTGLPRTVFVSMKRGSHDARVKISNVAGDRIDYDSAAVVAIRPEPRLLHGDLDTRVFRQVAAWIELNREVLMDHWEGRADGGDLIERLQRLPG